MLPEWWTRRELNPCPKTSWYNLLRGQSYLLKIPSKSAGRQALSLVALWCLTDTRAKSRFKFTTNLTHGGSRSPHPRYGRHFWPRHSLRCKSNSIVVVYYLSWTLLRDYPARHAYHTSKSPSKPLRAHIGFVSTILLYPIRVKKSRWYIVYLCKFLSKLVWAYEFICLQTLLLKVCDAKAILNKIELSLSEAGLTAY